MTPHLAVVALALAASPTLAETHDCETMPSLADGNFSAARVVRSKTPVHFRNAADCDDAATGCVRKGYVVAGNALIVTQRARDRSCAVFLTPRGAEFWGWLPNAALTLEPAPAPSPQIWVGLWTQIEGSIEIAPATGGRLSITGEATYGAFDPDRIRRGAVNTGAIEAVVKPDGNRLSFAMGEDGARSVTRPYAAAQDYECAVRMQRVGRWLLVEDNGKCGGMNVRFDGIYERARGR